MRKTFRLLLAVALVLSTAAPLLADTTIPAIQGRRFRDNRFVQHQQDGAHPPFQAAFEPPFACRQVSGRKAN